MTPRIFACLLASLAAPPHSAAHAQARYAGFAPGTYIAVGATGSSFHSDYGHQRTFGGTLFLDTNLYRRVGAEVEMRAQPLSASSLSNQHAQPGSRISTFLAGPKISSHGRTWRPYAKLLAGRGTFTFPFNTAQGTYFVAAAGAGLDWRPPHRDLTGDATPSRFLIRIVDVEYQIWPSFTFGPLHPYGISTGVSFRVY